MDNPQTPPEQQEGDKPEAPQVLVQEGQKQAPEEKKSETAQTQQPHLTEEKAPQEKKEKKKKKEIPLPFKSFILAFMVISITIALGIGFAVLLGRLTNKGLTAKPESKFSSSEKSRPTWIPTESTTPETSSEIQAE